MDEPGARCVAGDRMDGTTVGEAVVDVLMSVGTSAKVGAISMSSLAASILNQAVHHQSPRKTDARVITLGMTKCAR